eukprot:3028526-Alexandrium_andersonii.AAC.1
MRACKSCPPSTDAMRNGGRRPMCVSSWPRMCVPGARSHRAGPARCPARARQVPGPYLPRLL